MSQRLNKRLLLLLMLGVVGVLTILYSTRWGIGLNHDPLNYISGAENLVRGQGYSHVTPMGEVKPTIQWPPLYSVALTPFGFAGMSIFEGARWLNALLFGLNILLVGYIVYVKAAFWPSVLASFLTLTSVLMINVHAVAWSEGLYVFLGLSGLYFLDSYLTSTRLYPLILSALFISAATLTRYIGVTLIATMCIGVLILNKRGGRQRFRDCLIAGLISSLPLLLWEVRNRLVAGHIANIKVQFHPIKARHIKQGLDTIGFWLPESIPSDWRSLTLLVIVAAIVIMGAWLRKTGALSFLYLNVIYILTYCLGLALFISFYSLAMGFSFRYLSPVFVSVVLILTLYLHRISLRARRSVVIGITVLCFILSLSYVPRAVSFVEATRQNGSGYEGRTWKESGLISLVKSLPDNTRIYSQYSYPIAFLTQRKIGDLPQKFDQHTDQPVSEYFQKLKEIHETSQSQRTVILYTNNSASYFLSENELKQTLSLEKIGSFPEGSLYEVLP